MVIEQHPSYRASLRWALFAVMLLLGAALVGVSISNYTGARALSTTIERGQGDAFLTAWRQMLPPTAGPPSAADLQRLLDAQSVHGLRYAAFVVPGQGVLAEAGAPSSSAIDASAHERLAPGTPQRVGDRVRLTGGPPPGPPPPRGKAPPPLGKAPPPGKAPPLADAAPGERGGPPPGFPPPSALPYPVIEFEPMLAAQLRARAQRNLAVGLTSALVLVLIAGVLLRMWSQADRTAAALARQQHLAALGEMSAVLAHELRNPLTSLKGHAQLLEEVLEDNALAQRKAGRIVHEAVRLQQLTTALLDFARSGEITRADVSPAELVADAVMSSAGPHAPTIAVDREGAPERWSLDPLRFHQVLTNLLKNAIQASPADKPPSVAIRERGGSLLVEIRDYGDGVPPEQLATIFEPFKTTRVRGTGLGLAVARRVVELHDGIITAENHPEGGAVFRVVIPA